MSRHTWKSCSVELSGQRWRGASEIGDESSEESTYSNNGQVVERLRIYEYDGCQKVMIHSQGVIVKLQLQP